MTSLALHRQALPTLRGSHLLRRRLSVLLLAAVAAVLCFSRLRLPLLEPEEARYAEIPREMLAGGRWLVPAYHGQPYYDKPPLAYWLVMASYRVFGVHDWSARLVARLALYLCPFVVYFGCRRTVGWRRALTGAFLLCLSARFLYLGRLLTLDVLLCLWVVAALAAAHWAVRRPALAWGWWLLAAGLTGLGVLTKGPVALVLVAVPVLAQAKLDPRAARPGVCGWLGFLTMIGAVSSPWYLAVLASDPAFAAHFFWKHNVLRYVAPFDHPKPFWFYLPELLLGMLPWTLLLPSLLVWIVGKWRHGGRRLPSAVSYWAVASIWCLVFFSASGCKRAVYLLPAVPPLALALGCGLDRHVRRWTVPCRPALELPARLRPRLAWSALLLVLAAGAGIGWVALGHGLLHPQTGAVWLILTGVAAGVLLWRRRGLGRPAVWGLCSAATFALMAAGIQGILPAYFARHSLRHEVRLHAGQAGLAHFPVVCYPTLPDSVCFYLRRDDVRGYPKEKGAKLIADVRDGSDTLAFIKSGDSLKTLLRGLPAGLEFVPCGRQAGTTTGWIRRAGPGIRERTGRSRVLQTPGGRSVFLPIRRVAEKAAGAAGKGCRRAGVRAGSSRHRRQRNRAASRTPVDQSRPEAGHLLNCSPWLRVSEWPGSGGRAPMVPARTHWT